nr:uncharacterized mitochondrial protein AtMg00810-like [Tanacetum cinerariifolium]
MVDSFIPSKRAKEGKRFGFVRFINVFSVKRLVNNLCMIWVGRLKLNANVARFNRENLKSSRIIDKTAKRFNKISHNTFHKTIGNKDIGNSFMNVVKGSGRIAWVEVEGIPFKLWSGHTFNRIASKWGKLMEVHDYDDTNFHSTRLCILTKVYQNILGSFKIVFRGKVYWMRAKEVLGWTPEFIEDEEEDDVSVKDNHGGIHSDQEINNCNNESDVMEVPETCFNVPEGIKLMIVVVYDPQEASEKHMLWDYLTHVSDKWDSEIVLLGDFNEVRYKSERFGSNFKAHDANIFNSFIHNAGLNEVHLGGGAFTWLNSRGVLAKHKEDIRMFDEAIDKGNSPVEMVHKRLETLNKIHQVNNTHMSEDAKKAKIKWVVEGDENTKFFHGMLNKKLNQRSIRGIMDPAFPAKVYKVEKAMGTIDQTLFIRRQREDFILVQVYVDDIIFGSSNPQLCREFEALIHEKFQMSAMVKRIFRYLKGHPKMGLWYPKASPFDLVAYLDSDYGGASQDRKSTTGGSQFLGRRLISWQCKKQTNVATSTTEAEYVAAASCCGQVLWIQNQLLDYG